VRDFKQRKIIREKLTVQQTRNPAWHLLYFHWLIQGKPKYKKIDLTIRIKMLYFKCFEN
jgi:hypothetical protein